MESIKPLITKAFRILRRKGYTAKQNFWCCQNCAWNALTKVEAEKAVFYHNQDAERLKKTNSTLLAWSGSGEEIVEVLRSVGLEVYWDGSELTRIAISAKGE